MTSVARAGLCAAIWAAIAPAPAAQAGTGDGSPFAAVASCLYGAEATAAARRGCAGIYADACMDSAEGGTTLGMSRCIAEETEAWEAVIADDWKRLREGARRLDEAMPEAEALTALRRARRAWMAYREAECRAAAAPYSGGTIYGVVFGQCALTLTADRAVAQRARIEDEESR